MTEEGDQTFMRITNKEIYQGILDLQREVRVLSEHVQTTNGKVKWNKKMITMVTGIGTTIIMILVGILVWIIQNVQYR